MPKQQSVYQSIRVAFIGLYTFFRIDRNGRIELAMAALAIVASILFKISATEWLFVLLSIGMVLVTEIINSNLEKLCNLITMEYHPMVKVIKDTSAAAVLITAIVSVVVGCIIFLPKIFALG